MKKIAVFHPSSELYGADRIMVLAVKALSEYEPVIYLPSTGKLTDFIRKEIPHARVKIVPDMPVISRALFSPKGFISVSQKWLRFKKLMAEEHRHFKFDLVYINTLACSALLPIVKKLNIPVFTHVHEILERPVIVARITAKMAFKYSDIVVSVSKAVQDNLHRHCKKRKGQSIIVHNGIDPIRCPFRLKDEELSFYLFGRIKPEKGQWYLLEALKLIPKEELEGVKFNLVGGTLRGKENLKTDLEKKIQQADLVDVVNLKGFTNDISEEMAKADVCLIPSLMKDPFPTTVLEAMSAGKAVIASNTGGAREAIQHNTNGYIIPADDANLFAAFILKLIRNRALINEIGNRAVRSFESHFTTNHFNLRLRNAIGLN